MEALVPYAIWAVLILVGLSLLVMLVFGARSVAYGKVSLFAMGAVLLPVLLLFILGFATGDWPYAAILSLLILLGLASLALLLSGLRSAIGL